MIEFKRAMLSLTRRKGKTIILLVVIFIIGNVIAGAIAISQATAKSETQLKNSLGSVASIQVDYEKMMQDPEADFSNIPTLDEEWIKTLGARPEVKSYDYSTHGYLKSTEYKRYTPDEQTGGMAIANTGGEGNSFSLRGVQDHNVLDITDGKMDLVDGRVFTEDEIKNKKPVTLVSRQFAEENNVQVGSSIVLQQEIMNPEESNKVITSLDEMPKPIETQDTVLEIIGIFDLKPKKQESNDQDKKKNDMGMSAFMDAEKLNSFYVPNGYIADLVAHEKERLIELLPTADLSNVGKLELEPTYILKSPDDLASFEAAVKAELPEGFSLSTSSDEYKKVAGPIESLKTMSRMTLMVAIAAGITIVGLIMMLFLRERKHEMGIYLSIGAPKAKIVTQIMLEIIIVAIIAITASLGTGNMLAKGLSNSMIKNQQLQALENGNSNAYYFNDAMSSYGGDVSEDDAVDSFNISLTPQYIIIFYIVGLGTIIVSTLIPIIYFLRLNPKQIML